MIPETFATESVFQRRLEQFFAGLFILFPLGMGSIRNFSAIILLLMVLSGILLGIVGKCKPTQAQFKVVFGVLLLVAVALLSFTNAEDIAAGFRRLEKLVDLLCLLPLFYGVANCRYDLGRKFIFGLLCAAPVNLGIALYSITIGGLHRAQGYYHPIIFGDLSMLAVLLLFVWQFGGANRKIYTGSVPTWCALFFYLLVVYFSGTRGAWLALPPVVGWVFWWQRACLSRIAIKNLRIPLIVLVALVLLVVTYGGDTGILNRYKVHHSRHRTFSDASGSSNARLKMWKLSLRLFEDHPFLGTGLGDFSIETDRARTKGSVKLYRDQPHAHSIYFEYLGMTGLLGFVTMLFALFGQPAKLLLTKREGMVARNFQVTATLTVLICFAAFGLTEQWLARSAMVCSFIVALCAFFPRSDSQELAS